MCFLIKFLALSSSIKFQVKPIYGGKNGLMEQLVTIGEATNTFPVEE